MAKSEPAIGPLNLALRGVPGDAQYLVIIPSSAHGLRLMASLANQQLAKSILQLEGENGISTVVRSLYR